jgi:hypothetical protein
MTAGTASVVDRRGRTYHGFVTLSDGIVTLVGWRRERPWHTADGQFETRYACAKTWPIGRIDHIDWTTDATFELGSAA